MKSMSWHRDYPMSTVEFFSNVWDMIALESPEGPGSPQLLTGLLNRTLPRMVEFEPETLLDVWTQVGLLPSSNSWGPEHDVTIKCVK